ncbi:hypothetical protein EDD86DRAFT_249532 [Gorgonomyces haynaldii]|nr:hypothetical protein EDD86DRAFT_249532 [Gorgonomyces haynaldii]
MSSREVEMQQMPITKRICLEFLMQGNIHSFITFFQAFDTMPEDILGFQKLLTDLEKGNVAVYKALKELAEFFTQQNQPQRAIEYFEQSLEEAKKIQNDSQYEIDATHNLREALSLLDKSVSLASEHGNLQGQLLAKSSLYEELGDFESAIPHHEKSLENHVPNDAPNEILYKLGQAYQALGSVEKAIKNLELFLMSTREHNSKQKEGWAQCALANCYEKAGNDVLACTYLEQFIQQSEGEQSQLESAVKACNQLGNIYNRLEKYDMAVSYFEKHFKLGQKLSESQTHSNRQTIKTSKAQVQLSISKANAKMPLFFEAIADSNGINALLKWKSERTFGDYLPPSMVAT